MSRSTTFLNFSTADISAASSGWSTPDETFFNTEYSDNALPPRWHNEPPGTQYWPEGQYAQWARRETILPGTPPGDYPITATIFDLATLAPDSVVDENGSP
ncbi:MAG: hypothetical protein AAB592_05890, partial [Patescibacteria group bacterium]